MSNVDFWKPLKEKKYTSTIKLSVQIEFSDTDENSAHNHAWDVAEQLSSYLGCARGDYPTEPEIDDVTIKEEESE
jgi:hypothetical protein